jgi:hypothetical protein
MPHPKRNWGAPVHKDVPIQIWNFTASPGLIHATLRLQSTPKSSSAKRSKEMVPTRLHNPRLQTPIHNSRKTTTRPHSTVRPHTQHCTNTTPNNRLRMGRDRQQRSNQRPKTQTNKTTQNCHENRENSRHYRDAARDDTTNNTSIYNHEQ